MHPGFQKLAVFPVLPLHRGELVILVFAVLLQNVPQNLPVKEIRSFGNLKNQRLFVERIKQCEQSVIVPAASGIIPGERRGKKHAEHRRHKPNKDRAHPDKPQKPGGESFSQRKAEQRGGAVGKIRGQLHTLYPMPRLVSR